MLQRIRPEFASRAESERAPGIAEIQVWSDSLADVDTHMLGWDDGTRDFLSRVAVNLEAAAKILPKDVNRLRSLYQEYLSRKTTAKYKRKHK